MTARRAYIEARDAGSAEPTRMSARASGVVPHVSYATAQRACCFDCGVAVHVQGSPCDACLVHRAPRWAEMLARCETDPDFALAVFSQATSDHARAVFLALFGSRMMVGRGTTKLTLGGGSPSAGPSAPREWTCRTTMLPPPPDDEP